MIYRTNPNDTDSQELLRILVLPSGLAIDPIGRKLSWSDLEKLQHAEPPDGGKVADLVSVFGLASSVVELDLVNSAMYSTEQVFVQQV